MKLEIARALFLVGALGVTTVAAASWGEARPTVFSKSDAAGQCALPRVAKAEQGQAKPDNDLLLFLFGMRQGLRPFG
ncbi:hypothetical protein ACE1YR_17945 [Pseudomonas sp. K1(2024)]|uniref:Lipoprotein n=2 Tax=Pseudomonas TaxID=286 RepID=A0AAI8PCM0_9PSED|nr:MULTISPECIES: hypothetical protein [Pseudomonas]AIZ33904.1 hypothetical protein NJ69_13335 [Pseudomonas parafulva]AXO89612.1 hypothetical protein DZC75_16960 [Pseudomonas parafulva]MDO7901774.1 hypothetical protein [Pseudomonas sp. K13]